MGKNKRRRQERMNRINSNMSSKIVLTDYLGNELNFFITDIRRYRATDVTNNGTWIEMNSGVEYRVIQNFDEVDRVIESKLPH